MPGKKASRKDPIQKPSARRSRGTSPARTKDAGKTTRKVPKHKSGHTGSPGISTT